MGGLQATCRLGNKVEITFGEKRGVPLRAGNDPGPSGSVFRRTGHLPRPAGSCRWGPHGTGTAKPLSLPPAGPSATGQGGAGLPGTGTRGVSAHHPPRSLLGLGRGPRGCKNHTVSSTPAGGHYPSTFALGPSSRVRNLFSSPFTSSFPKREPPAGPLTSHGVGSPLRAVMKLGAQEPHRTNPVSTPAKVAAAAAPLRRENHTSGAAPRGAAPRAPRRRARCSGAAAPRLPAAEPLRGAPGGRAAARGWAGEEERSYVRKKQEKHAEAEERGLPRGWQSMCAFTWQRRPSAAPRCGFPLRSHSNARSENETQWESGKEAYSGGWAVPPPPPRPLSAPPPIAAARPAPPPRVAPRAAAAARPGPARQRGLRAATCARPGSAGGSCPAGEAGRGGGRMGPACRALEIAEEGSGRRESPRAALLVRRMCPRGERRRRSVTTVWPSSENFIFWQEWESLVVSHFLIKEGIWTSKAICFPV